jgi:hypothetical protein
MIHDRRTGFSAKKTSSSHQQAANCGAMPIAAPLSVTRFANLSFPCRAFESHPWRSFILFAAVHIFVWSILPSTIFTNPFMDVIEGLTYGHEWQLGYDKHPPLAWWIVEATHRLIDHQYSFF